VTTPDNQVVVIGAGTAGLAAALCLGDLAVPTVVLDRGRVAESWRSRYDGLRLVTERRNSHLPKRPDPGGTASFPSRDGGSSSDRPLMATPLRSASGVGGVAFPLNS
jgi:cation diffusion facilitator CzcD-associated flavoprotein CzcO